jgi:hypothetical protein
VWARALVLETEEFTRAQLAYQCESHIEVLRLMRETAADIKLRPRGRIVSPFVPASRSSSHSGVDADLPFQAFSNWLSLAALASSRVDREKSSAYAAAVGDVRGAMSQEFERRDAAVLRNVLQRMATALANPADASAVDPLLEPLAGS